MDNLELTLNLTVSQVQVILTALGKLPLETSVSVWMSIKAQGEKQIADAAQAVSLTPADTDASE